MWLRVRTETTFQRFVNERNRNIIHHSFAKDRSERVALEISDAFAGCEQGERSVKITRKHMQASQRVSRLSGNTAPKGLSSKLTYTILSTSSTVCKTAGTMHGFNSSGTCIHPQRVLQWVLQRQTFRAMYSENTRLDFYIQWPVQRHHLCRLNARGVCHSPGWFPKLPVRPPPCPSPCPWPPLRLGPMIRRLLP